MIRGAIFVIVSIILLNSLFFIVVAVYKSVYAYVLLAQGRIEEKPGIMLAESLDSFLVALFFIIFSLGISKLFLPDSKLIKGYDLPWLNIDSFSQLKYIMWEMLLTTIFVYFATKIIIVGDHLEWTMLIVPGSVLILAAAYKLLRHGH
jgi:uncharacterized membrane protein YqhA